jgi:hypothetical protein
MTHQNSESEKKSNLQATRRGVLLYEKNPFLMDVKTRTKRITNKSGDMMLVSAETGEIQNSIAGFWQSQEVDSSKFVKLFVNGVKALKELTNPGTKVFEVLYMRVQEEIGKDKIYLSFGFVDQAITPMSQATYKRGLAEIIEKGFIASTKNQGWYWLNPSYVWNGDRLAFVREYHKAGNQIKAVKDVNTRDLFSPLRDDSSLSLPAPKSED